MYKAKVFVFLLLSLSYGAAATAQSLEERVSILEEKAQTPLSSSTQSASEKQKYLPQLHGILRGKYEYEPNIGASRFEVRNARLSVEGNMPFRSSYKLEVDLCDESQIKMKDAWVRVNPWKTLRASIGQQRMPFSIDAHRNPSAQYLANRSFIAKQVGDMRDVGFQLGYDFLTADGRKILSVDAGVFNGSNLENQKNAWFKSPAYSARVQYYPIKGLAIMPSVQHQLIADRKASYTSVDLGAYYDFSGFHIEAEYLRKFYANGAFDDCNAINTMAIYKMPVTKGFLNGLSYLVRYDYMDNHSDGKKGVVENTKRLQQTDAQRHRFTAGLTFHVANERFPTEIRLNYEKYWYPRGGTPKESEQDKLVAELMIRF